jgi:zinc protease
MRPLIALMLAGGVAFAGKPDLSKAPPLPAPRKWSAPVPQANTTQQGVRVVTLPRAGLPLVHLLVTIQAGSELDPPGKGGLAAAVARMIEEGGAGTRGPRELLDALDELGGELQVDTDETGTRMGLTVLSSKVDRALALIGDMLARPRFDAGEWPSVRERQVAEILKDRVEPRHISEVVFQRVLYGDHPYAHASLGIKSEVDKLTVEDLKSFWAMHYGPKTTTVMLIGDAQIDRARLQVQTSIGTWDSKAVPPPLPANPPAPVAKVVIVDRPGAPQSELRIGHIGIPFSSPELAAANVIETVLGGAFTSRLNQNLREKHGYTYGVRARFAPSRAPGWFEVRCAVRTDVTAESIKEVLGELKLDKPISVEETSKARSLLGQKLVDVFGSGMMASMYFSDILLHNQPLDLGSRVDAAIQKLEAPAIADAYKRLIKTDALAIVIVGDKKVIEPKLREVAGYKGPIEYRDVDGEIIK